MNIGLRELRRKPLRFGAAGAALVLLTVLLLLLGGFLDGLFLGSTGFLRAQKAELITFSSDAKKSLLRSRIDPAERAQVAGVAGVEGTDGLGIVLLGATVPGRTEVASAAVVGYQGAVTGVPDPPAPGEAYADRRLEADGVQVGQTLLLGPQRVPITVVGWVSDTSYLLQGGLWTEPGTWRNVLASARPDANLPDGTFQALAVTTAPGADPTQVAAAIDAATGGSTTTVTRQDAVLSLPGIKEQQGTFTAIISVTLVVAGLVVALFFALLTLERIGLYGVFKAIGASTGQIFSGVVVQAVVLGVVSFAIGAATAWLLSRPIPAAVPLQLVPGRVVVTGVLLVVMAVVGSAFSLRRVVKVDPASAIG